MFPYIPNTEKDINEMLKVIGVESVDDLFRDIPEQILLNDRLNINKPLSEIEVSKHIKSLASKNTTTDDMLCFLGAGSYDHYVPTLIHHLISRSEFYTSYTPYQPEISQGTLQAIFEYQSMITELTGMDVSNASLYDGQTAAAEAAMMACGKAKGNKIVISKTVHPEIRNVVKTYMRFQNIEVVEVNEKDGMTDLSHFEEIMDKDVCGVIVQSPNFFGIVEDFEVVVETTHANKALAIMHVDPISSALFKTPGEYGVDIAVGEGQPLGVGLNFGGPYLGFIATTTKLMRKLPGRICGQSEDLDGNRAFVLTLQAREQHIRREKATSNICSNQSLVALSSAIYLSILGKEGILDVASQSANKAYYAYNKLTASGKFKTVFEAPFFREFVIETPMSVAVLNEKLAEKGILGGYDISKAYSDKENQALICVTEKRTKEEIDFFCEVMEAL